MMCSKPVVMKLGLEDKDELHRQRQATKSTISTTKKKWYPEFSGKVVRQVEIEGLRPVRMGDKSGQSDWRPDIQQGVSVFSRGWTQRPI